MNTTTFRQSLARRFLSTIPLLFIVSLLFIASGIPVHQAAAHAELVRAEPPIDGLIVAPPDRLQLFFSENVASSNPAPSVRLLDENGKEKSVTVEAQGSNAQEVVVDIPSLGNGTWTVAWTVKSADDGHILSGTYAFRIGGGLPPGLATVEGQQPQAWAVTTRWLTFLGAAIAGAGFLFGVVLFGRDQEPVRSSRKRTRFILAGAFVALVATIIEPFMQVLFPVQDVNLTIGSAIRGLPLDWWYRPTALVPLVILAVFAAYPLRGRIPLPIGILGGALALISLLGLSLTSHPAARESLRSLAITSDTLHQWSTALWVGGLFSLVLWWSSRPATAPSPGDSTSAADLPFERFSAIAVWLFIIAVLTGGLNAWLVLPHKETSIFGIGDASIPAISKLWTSDYGVVLLIKILILLIPFGLAIYHRRAIARATRTGARVAAGVLSKTLRLESIVVCAVVLGGSILALSAPPTISQHALQNVSLASLAVPAQGVPTEIVHLTIDPATQGKNSLSLRLTDTQGRVPAVTTPARLAMTFTSLSHGTVRSDVSVQPSNLAAATYTAGGLDLSIDGWWKIEVNVEQANQPVATADFYLLLPDPNVHGFNAPSAPATDPAAQAAYEKALKSLTSLTAIRRTEIIGSGRDALVIAENAWTTGTNGHPPSFQSETLFSGSFVPQADGSPPRPPITNAYLSVAIGGQAWQIVDGKWLEQSPILYLPPSEWESTYTGAQEFQFGTTEVVDGEECQIITFHTPNVSSQSEAWFAWWVGKNSGQVRQTSMVANQHYMVWHYRDFNSDFVIQGPPAPSAPATPAAPATPTASPASSAP